jgi:DNA-binding NarL/FixJ family response regulator
MSRIRILIADDEKLFTRLLLRRLAQEPDLEVVGEASNGKEAVELAQSLEPDVILMDLQMPGLNGAQATEKIRALQTQSQVVMLTAL